jgi:CRP-like cAMP-binding protein
MFEQCPFDDDCRGFFQQLVDDQSDKNVSEDASSQREDSSTTILADRYFRMQDVEEGCTEGTEGVLCNACSRGYIREGLACVKCSEEGFGLRLAIVFGMAIFVGLFVSLCKRRLKVGRLKRYRILWRDILRILSINVTFAQIGSSLANVIDVDWPPNFLLFLNNLDFVNIDFMSLIGASCVGDFSFTISFSCMTALPVAIVFFAFAEYVFEKNKLRSQLSNMTGIERKHREEEALHLLFKIADSDNSGHIDPSETKDILTQLGWRGVDVSTSVKLLIAIGANLDDHGSYILTEAEFVEGMVSGTLTKELVKLKDDQRKRGKSKARTRSFFTSKSPHRRQKSRLRMMRDNAEREAILSTVIEAENGKTSAQKEVLEDRLESSKEDSQGERLAKHDNIPSSSSTEGAPREKQNKASALKKNNTIMGGNSETQYDGGDKTLESEEKVEPEVEGGSFEIEPSPPLQKGETKTKTLVAATTEGPERESKSEEQGKLSSGLRLTSPSVNADTLQRQDSEQQSHGIVIMKQIRALQIQLLNSAADETVELQAKIEEKKSRLANMRAQTAMVINSKTPENILVADYNSTFTIEPVSMKKPTPLKTVGPKIQAMPEPLISVKIRSELPQHKNVSKMKMTLPALCPGKKRTKKVPKQKKNDARKRRADKKLGGNLSNADKLVRWTLERQLISNAMSAATQLLLLAHTPVSRKVFQYFHCNAIAGRHFLRADYRLECWSARWWAFLPVVLAVLIGFTIALPAVISWYLFVHRRELYSTSVYQTIGWLYDPYVRGAEFWQVHDVLLKMVLTGMLIYVPTIARASVAIILCLLAIANLNFFEPHKNRVLFWLTQLSFLVTATKYVTTLMLGAQDEDLSKEGHLTIGTLLISLDIFFLISSIISIIMAFWLLRAKMKSVNLEEELKKERLEQRARIQQKRRKSLTNGAEDVPKEKRRLSLFSSRRKSKTGPLVFPIPQLHEREQHKQHQQSEADSQTDAGDRSSGETVTKIIIDSEEHESVTDLPIFPTREEDAIVPLYTPLETQQRRSSTVRTVDALMSSFDKHTKSLHREQSQRQQQQKRQTQLRVLARARVKQTNALSKISMFSDCNSDTVGKIVDSMTYDRFQPGDVLCNQGDVADRFFVIVTGQCGVTVLREDIMKMANSGNDDKATNDAATKSQVGASTSSSAGAAIPALGFHRFTKKERVQVKAKMERKARNHERIRAGLVVRENNNRDRLARQPHDLHDKVVPQPAKTPKEDTIRVGTLKALEVFGESALLPADLGKDVKTRAATVTAEGDATVQVLSISSKGFSELVDGGVLDGTRILKMLQAEAAKREKLTRTRSRRSQENSQFVMVKCDLCDKWRHVEELVDGRFTCADIGEHCATGVLL